MNIYQIDQQIQACIDETGEVIDFDQLIALQMERERKIENVACWIIDLQAEAKAIKDQIVILRERFEAAEAKAESLKRYLLDALDGEKFKTGKVSVGYRRSVSVDVQGVEGLPEEYIRTKITKEPDKAAIKEAICAGKDLPGCTLVHKTSVVVK